MNNPINPLEIASRIYSNKMEVNRHHFNIFTIILAALIIPIFGIGFDIENSNLSFGSKDVLFSLLMTLIFTLFFSMFFFYRHSVLLSSYFELITLSSELLRKNYQSKEDQTIDIESEIINLYSNKKTGKILSEIVTDLGRVKLIERDTFSNSSNIFYPSIMFGILFIYSFITNFLEFSYVRYISIGILFGITFSIVYYYFQYHLLKILGSSIAKGSEMLLSN